MKKTIFITAVMLLLCLSNRAAAATPISGACGTSASYVLDAEGVLTITGTGVLAKPADGLDPSEVSQLIIGEGITDMGSFSFARNWTLTSVSLPGTMTKVTERAFEFCLNLTMITLAEGIQTIGKAAFSSCRNIENITLPESMTCICDSAFITCSSLKEIVIPNSVTTIGNEAFRDCRGMKTVSLPSALTSLGRGAFQSCEELRTDIVIPVGVSTIPHNCFYNCVKMNAISIGFNVKTIYLSAFPYTIESINNGKHTSITSFLAAEFYEVEKNIYARYEELASGTCGASASYALYNDGKMIISGSGVLAKPVNGYNSADVKEIIVGNGITGLGTFNFKNHENLASVELPQTMTAIADSAFYNCGKLTAFEMPAEIKSIGNYSFLRCGLKEVELPSTLEDIGSRAFEYCPLTSIVIPNTVQTVGLYAFSNCEKLTSAVIEMTEITTPFFILNTKLSSITIGESVSRIHKDAFKYIPYNCVFNGRYPNENTFYKYEFNEVGDDDYRTRKNNAASGICGTGTYYVLDDEGVLMIGGTGKIEDLDIGDFKTNITKVEIEDSVTDLGDLDFMRCRNLTSAKLPSCLTEIPNSIFYLCDKLQYTIPEGITHIRSNAFLQCYGLTKLTLPESLLEIGYGAFALCGIDTLIIPTNVTSIGIEAFSGCESLKSVVFSSGVKEIPKLCFNDCGSLMSVSIHDSISTIYISAFQNVPFSCLFNETYEGIDEFLAAEFQETENGKFTRKKKSTVMITSPTTDAVIVSTEEYGLNGVKSDSNRGLKVVRTVYSDGTIKSSLRSR